MTQNTNKLLIVASLKDSLATIFPDWTIITEGDSVGVLSFETILFTYIPYTTPDLVIWIRQELLPHKTGCMYFLIDGVLTPCETPEQLHAILAGAFEHE